LQHVIHSKEEKASNVWKELSKFDLSGVYLRMHSSVLEGPPENHADILSLHTTNW
jgi:hypothetical protein